MIFDGNSWRPLATHPSYWTDTHAEVVCHQLGYQGGVVPYNTSGYRLEIAYLIISAGRINICLNNTYTKLKTLMDVYSMCVLFVSYSQPTDLVSYQANLECLSLAKGLGECTDTQEFSQSPKLAAVSCTLSGQWPHCCCCAGSTVTVH